MSEPIIAVRPDDLLGAAQALAHTEPDEENDWLPGVADEELRAAMIQSALWYWVRDRVNEMIHDTAAEIEGLPAFATAPFEQALQNAEYLGTALPVPWPAQLVRGPVEIDVWRDPGSRKRTAAIRRLELITPTDDTGNRRVMARNWHELEVETLAAFDAWRQAAGEDVVMFPNAYGACPCPPELAARAVWE